MADVLLQMKPDSANYPCHAHRGGRGRRLEERLLELAHALVRLVAGDMRIPAAQRDEHQHLVVRIAIP